jgi:cytochrome b6-f complex iron-sulfur subunit
MADLSRRDFLSLARNILLWLSGGLTLAGLFRYLDFDTNPAPRTRFDIGAAENYPMGSRTLLNEPPAVLLHTENGFSALSLVCTHLGCTVEQADSGFACPCHGSRFDKDGNVTHGPAEKHLRVLRLELADDGHLIIDTG